MDEVRWLEWTGNSEGFIPNLLQGPYDWPHETPRRVARARDSASWPLTVAGVRAQTCSHLGAQTLMA